MPRYLSILLLLSLSLFGAYAQEAPLLDHEARLSAALQELPDLQRRLDAPVPKTETITAETASEARRLALTAELEAAQDTATALVQEASDRDLRLAKLPEEIATLRQTLESTEAGETRDDLTQQLDQYESELRFLTESVVWFAARKDLATRRVTRLTEELSAVADALGESEADEAQQALVSLEATLKTIPNDAKQIRVYADGNLVLARQRVGMSGLVQEVADQTRALATSEAKLRQIEDQFAGAVRRLTLLESAELTIDEETGEMLRDQRGALPSVADMKRQLVVGIRRAATVQLSRVKAEDERRGLTMDFHQAVTALDPNASATATQLVQTRKNLLDATITDLSTLQNVLESNNEVLRDKIARTTEFKQYLNRQLLWLRSADPLGPSDFVREARGVAELFTGAPAANWTSRLRDDLRGRPGIWLLGLAVSSYLFWRRRAFKRHYIQAAAGAKSGSEFRPTLIALFYSLARCATILFPLWFLIWRTDGTAFSIGKGLVAAATALTVFVILREFSRVPDGLLIAHLSKTRSVAERLREVATRLSWALVPPLFFAIALSAMHPTGEGRLSFVAVLLVAAYQAHGLLRPSVGLLTHLGFRSTYARAFYGACVFGLIGLAIATLLGYFVSARSVSEKFANTLGILFLAAFASAILLRWVQVSRKKVARRVETNRRQAAQREAKQGVTSESPAEAGLAEKQRSSEEYAARKAMLSKSQEDTQRLVRVLAVLTAGFAIWGVWSSSLPALSVLNKVNVWSGPTATETVADSPQLPFPDILPSETASDSESEAVVSRNVTLQDLILALFIGTIVFVAARHLPATLDLLVLQKLSLEPGSAFAITTTIRYLVVGIGVAMVFSRLGIEWDKIQWIAAAVTVGIGFGLQEIFANFVAGLIILFERPIRLGDFVTLSDVSGQVSKIRIRATTIRDFSNKELVVPNKEFITGQLINWTLTDPVMRLEIPVGIAYGSDTALATRELEKVAREAQDVLQTPSPSVAFMNFGESSLDFDLRVFIRGAENIVPVQSRIRYAIDAAFREAGIEIAFPQRDLHIRSLPERATAADVEAALRDPSRGGAGI